jgi:hypothetical protein
VADAASLLERAGRVRAQARQARKLALAMRGPDQARAIRFAEELEEKADRLEQLAAAGGPLPTPTTHQQHQLQQQETEPPLAAPDGKPKS